MGVAKVVETESFEFVVFQQFPEFLVEKIRIDRSAIFPGEYKVFVFVDGFRRGFSNGLFLLNFFQRRNEY